MLNKSELCGEEKSCTHTSECESVRMLSIGQVTCFQACSPGLHSQNLRGEDRLRKVSPDYTYAMNTHICVHAHTHINKSLNLIKLWDWRYDQMVKCLPCRHDDLSLVPRTHSKKAGHGVSL